MVPSFRHNLCIVRHHFVWLLLPSNCPAIASEVERIGYLECLQTPIARPIFDKLYLRWCPPIFSWSRIHKILNLQVNCERGRFRSLIQQNTSKSGSIFGRHHRRLSIAAEAHAVERVGERHDFFARAFAHEADLNPVFLAQIFAVATE